eukprot:9791202-Alexandrium_andersonii.AAC.1
MFFTYEPTHRSGSGASASGHWDRTSRGPGLRPVSHRGLEGTGGSALHYHARGPLNKTDLADHERENRDLL